MFLRDKSVVMGYVINIGCNSILFKKGTIWTMKERANYENLYKGEKKWSLRKKRKKRERSIESFEMHKQGIKWIIWKWVGRIRDGSN